MSTVLDKAQAQWLEQLEAMRKAIAELNLPFETERTPAYGDDLDLLDDDLSGTTSGEDIWDVISNEYEEEYSSDGLEQSIDGKLMGSAYDQAWLAERCAQVAGRGSGLDATALTAQILAVLASDSNGKCRGKAGGADDGLLGCR
jgi:antiviral helicase SLH1